MATLARLEVDLIANPQGFVRGIENATASFRSRMQEMSAIGSQLTTRVSLPLAGIGAAAFKMASDAEEAANKFSAVFGPAAEVAAQGLAQLHSTIPATTSELQELSAEVGGFLLSMGFTQEQAANLSVQFVEMGGDLASLNNTGAREAIQAIGSALRGESEPLSRFQVDTRVAALEQKALASGLLEAGQEMDRQTQALAILQAITEDASFAMGDAAGTAFSAANSFKFMNRNLREAGEVIGTEVIPVVLPLIQHFANLLQQVNQLDPRIVKLGVTVSAIAVAVGPVLKVLAALATFLSTPLGLAIAATVAAVVGLIDWIDRVRDAWDLWVQQMGRVRDFFGRFADETVEVFGRMFDTLLSIGQQMWDAIAAVFTSRINAIRDAVANGVGAIADMFAGLRQTLVGGSIVPDMMDEIVEEFRGLVTDMDSETGNATGAVAGQWSDFDTNFPPMVGSTVQKIGTQWSAVDTILNTDFGATLRNATENWIEFGKTVLDILNEVFNVVKKVANAVKGAVFGVQQTPGAIFGGQTPTVTGLPGFSGEGITGINQGSILGQALASQQGLEFTADRRDTILLDIAASNQAIQGTNADLVDLTGRVIEALGSIRNDPALGSQTVGGIDQALGAIATRDGRVIDGDLEFG